MRNAALVLGVIGGLLGLLVGFFSYGYVEAVDRFGEIEGLATKLHDEDLQDDGGSHDGDEHRVCEGTLENVPFVKR